MAWIAWVFGVAISALPIVLCIAGDPSQLTSLFEFKAYLPFFTEILFLGIALAAITIAEAGSLISERPKGARAVGCAVTSGLLVLAVIVLASWYGTALELRRLGSMPSVDAVEIAFWLDCAILMLCALLRASLRG